MMIWDITTFMNEWFMKRHVSKHHSKLKELDFWGAQSQTYISLLKGVARWSEAEFEPAIFWLQSRRPNLSATELGQNLFWICSLRFQINRLPDELLEEILFGMVVKEIKQIYATFTRNDGSSPAVRFLGNILDKMRRRFTVVRSAEDPLRTLSERIFIVSKDFALVCNDWYNITRNGRYFERSIHDHLVTSGMHCDFYHLCFVLSCTYCTLISMIYHAMK